MHVSVIIFAQSMCPCNLFALHWPSRTQRSWLPLCDVGLITLCEFLLSHWPTAGACPTGFGPRAQAALDLIIAGDGDSEAEAEPGRSWSVRCLAAISTLIGFLLAVARSY